MQSQTFHNMRPLILFLLTLTACKTSKTLQTQNRYLKEYSFCRCLYHASADSLKLDEISSSIYLDIGGFDLNVYSSADSLAKLFAQRIQPSIIADHEGKRPIILRCFEFSKGPVIDSLIKTLKRRSYKNNNF